MIWRPGKQQVYPSFFVLLASPLRKAGCMLITLEGLEQHYAALIMDQRLSIPWVKCSSLGLLEPQRELISESCG